MKPIFTFTFFFLLVAKSLFSQMTERDTVFKRFRSVNIQNDLKIELQANIKTLKDVTVKSTTDHYYLKKGSFVRADSIDIGVNKKGQIISISFFYPGSDYETMKKTYTKPLGEGEESITSNGGIITKTLLWEDDKTIFELIEITNSGVTKLYSVIIDKQLYSKKYEKK